MKIHYSDGIEVRRPRTPGRDALIGVAAGVAGTWAMNRFWSALQAFQEVTEDEDGGERPESDAADGPGEPEEQQETEGQQGERVAGESAPLEDVAVVGPYHRENESAPETLARLAYSSVRGVEPPAPVRQRLASRIHWAQGMSMGGVYGLARGRAGGADLRGGTVFGAALWLTADEVAVPLLGLAEGPGAHPPVQHLKGLGAHLVYGVATAVTAQLLQRAV